MSITTTTSSSATTPAPTSPAASRPASSGMRHRRTIALGLGAAGAVVAVVVAVAVRPAAPAAPPAPGAPASITSATGAVGARNGAQALEHAYGRSGPADRTGTEQVPPVTAGSPYAPVGPVGVSSAVRHYGAARATQLESLQTTASASAAIQARGNQQLTGTFRYGRGYGQ